MQALLERLALSVFSCESAQVSWYGGGVLCKDEVILTKFTSYMSMGAISMVT